MKVVNVFYKLAKEHKEVRGFRYGRSYEKGAGNDFYPLIWVDDPILGNAVSPERGAVLQYTVNVDVLCLPESGAHILIAQSEAWHIGLDMFQRLKTARTGGAHGITFSFITLSDYYDDNAAGIRFTFTLALANDVSLCDDNFDPDKKLEGHDPLPDFATENPTGCAIFGEFGLPTFK